jgi:hypothetical protein
VARINCVIPVTVTVRGRPGPDQIEALQAALVRALESRLALAASRIGVTAGERTLGPAELVRAPWDATRWDALAGGYRLPSYDDEGRPTTVPVRGGEDAGRAVRVEVYLAEELVVVFRDGSRQPLVFRLLSTQLEPGEYEWGFSGGTHRLSTGTRRNIVVRFRGRVRDLRVFARMMQGAEPVPARVLESAATAAPSTGGRTGGGQPQPGTPSGAGEAGEPLRQDFAVFRDNQPLAELYLDFLQRYAGLSVPRSRAAGGLTPEQVEQIVGQNRRARVVTAFFTQGVGELSGAGSNDLGLFSVLEETILTQWQRGNFNALRNRLQIGRDRQGFGIFLRGTPIKLYDELGVPIPSVGGGYRDEGFLAAEPPSFAIRIQLPPGLLQVFRAVQQTAVDEPVLVYQAAKAYVDNGDLLWPAIRDGWDGWSAISAELQRQIPILVGFLAGHTVALVLQRTGTPWGVAVGTTIEAILLAAGRLLQIVFIGHLLVLAYRAGRELSQIRRDAQGRLDALSQRHLDNAIVILRELLVAAVAAGLTAATVAAARSTALLLPPPGGGTGPTPALAAVTAGGRTRVRAGTGVGEATGPPPRVATPLLPPRPLQMSGREEPPPGERRPAETERQQPQPRREAEPGGRRGEPEPARQETGRQLERRLLREDRPTRPAESARYFARERTSFRNLLAALRRFEARLLRQGEATPFRRLDASVLEQNTQAFIESRPALAGRWRSWSRGLAERRASLDREIDGLRLRDPRRRELLRQRDAVDRQIEEMNAFERGKVGDKEPDIVELFPQESRIVVTDITQRVHDPFHNFKTRFYVEVLRALTGWTEVHGVEFRDVRTQQVID